MGDYEVAAREVLRLLSFFEQLFTKQQLYCAAEIDCDGGQYRWGGSRRGFEYCCVPDEWHPVKNVYDMEIAAGLLSRIEDLHVAALEEQSRLANVLGDAAEVGRSFAEKQLGDDDGKAPSQDHDSNGAVAGP
tara:strand:- start:836 stop:1231 length:396 start_codon:yes stop_codon:yes gene_type:complete